MLANNLYRGLFELLTAPHGDAASAVVLSNGRGTRRELITVARKEGCLPELYARWAADNLLSPTESVEHEQFARRRASVAAVLQALPAGTLLPGGADPGHADAALGVLLPDFAAIGALHEAVARIGYRLHGAGQWQVSLRDPLHRGVATYRYAMAGAAEGVVAIEVQVAGVPIDARRNVPFADFAEHAVRRDRAACRTLASTGQLLHRIAGFGARDAPVTVREIAELHLLLKDPAHRVDHAWLHTKVQQLDAWAGLRRVRDAIVAKRLSGLLSWGEFGRLLEASAVHGEAAAGKRSRSPRAGQFLRNTFGLIAGPRNNDVAARLARAPWLVSQVWNGGYRVQGVPVSTQSFDAPRLLRIDGALYLATGAGLILLSLVDLSEGARVEVGERVRRGSRPKVLARWSAARSTRRARVGAP